MTPVVEILAETTVCHDSFGFGIHARSPVALTSAAVFGIHNALRKNYPEHLDWPQVDPGFRYSDYIYTPWAAWNPRSAPEAISNRLQMRSLNTVADDSVASYCGSGQHYYNCWDTAFLPLETRLGLLRKFYPNPVGSRALVLGSAGGQFLFSLAQLGFDPYGMEIDPHLAALTHTILRPRVAIGDMLCHLYRYASDSFPVVFLCCAGYLQWPDIRRGLRGIWRIQPRGGVLVLHAAPDSEEVGDVAKARFGCYIRQGKQYTRALADSGYRPQAVSAGTLVAFKSHEPDYSEDWSRT